MAEEQCDEIPATSVATASQQMTGKAVDFFGQCLINLNYQYPDWEKKTWGHETICIPEAFIGGDIIQTTDENSTDYNKEYIDNRRTNINGHETEQLIHQAFQKSNTIGGIVINSIDTIKIHRNTKLQKIKEKNMKNVCYGADKRLKKGKGKTLELDFLLLHPQLGIVIIEVKASQALCIYEGKLATTSKFKEASTQLEHWFARMPLLFEVITGTNFTKCCIPISYILCFPNQNKIRKEDLLLNFPESYQHLDLEGCMRLLKNQPEDLKEQIGCAELSVQCLLNSLPDNFIGKEEMMSFDSFWERKIIEYEISIPSLEPKNYFANPAFKFFIGVLYGYRQKAEFLSLASSAIHVEHKVDVQQAADPNFLQAQQAAEKKKKKKKAKSTPAEKSQMTHSNDLQREQVVTEASQTKQNSAAFEKTKHDNTAKKPVQAKKTHEVQSTSSQEHNEEVQNGQNDKEKSEYTLWTDFQAALANLRQIPSQSEDNEISIQVNQNTTISSKVQLAYWNWNHNTSICLNADQTKVRNVVGNSNGRNVVILGPPGSGKTLLIMILAKEAAEKETPGRVLIFLPNESIAKLYEIFLTENNAGQKRQIIINPLRIGARKAAAQDSKDDVFVDEDYSGEWMTPGGRTAAITVTAITIGRSYGPKNTKLAKQLMRKRLAGSQYELFVLTTVMRNTKNIFNFFKQYFDLDLTSNSLLNETIPTETADARTLDEGIPLVSQGCNAAIAVTIEGPHGSESTESLVQEDTMLSEHVSSDIDPICLGHNITGRAVRIIESPNLAECCQKIAEAITQLLRDPFRGTVTDSSATSNRNGQRVKRKDIAIIVAHLPINYQVKKIKWFLERVGIRTGSIEEQMLMPYNPREPEDNTIVALDSSASVLSFEWLAVFVIDPSNCPYSKQLANPVVSLSRATSLLYVAKTIDCNDKEGRSGCGNREHSFYNWDNLSPDNLFLFREREHISFLCESFASPVKSFILVMLKCLPYFLLFVLGLFTLTITPKCAAGGFLIILTIIISSYNLLLMIIPCRIIDITSKVPFIRNKMRLLVPGFISILGGGYFGAFCPKLFDAKNVALLCVEFFLLALPPFILIPFLEKNLKFGSRTRTIFLFLVNYFLSWAHLTLYISILLGILNPELSIMLLGSISMTSTLFFMNHLKSITIQPLATPNHRNIA